MTLASNDLRRAFSDPEARIEGHLKVRGVARYAADASMPGVHAVLTGEDLGSTLWGRRVRDWPLLAKDRVRFIGDRLAVVAAESLQIAQAAIQAIDVQYEELPAIFDPREALADDAPILHPDGDGYTLFGQGERPPRAHPNVQGSQIVRKDDAEIEVAFEQ